MRQIIVAACGILIIVLAACEPNPPAVTPTIPKATLVGAVVPTRIPTETATSTPTETLTPSVTPTHTATPTQTLTRTPTATSSSTPTLTLTPTITLTPSKTFTPSSTPTQTPSTTPTPTVTPTTDGSTRIIIAGGETPIEVLEQNYTYQGEISDDMPSVRFAFEGAAGEMIGIQLQVEAGDLDPYLILTTSNGDILTENDDDPNGFGRDSYIREFVLPQDGRFIIIATRFEQEDGDSEGDFIFTLQREGGIISDATDVPSDGIQPIVCEETIEETIDDDTYTWQFSFVAVDAGEVIGVQMSATSGDLDSIVRLLNDEGDVIAENDDDPSGFGKDAFLRSIEIPAMGVYIIEASRFQDELGTTAGDFEIMLLCGANAG